MFINTFELHFLLFDIANVSVGKQNTLKDMSCHSAEKREIELGKQNIADVMGQEYVICLTWETRIHTHGK